MGAVLHLKLLHEEIKNSLTYQTDLVNRNRKGRQKRRQKDSKAWLKQGLDQPYI